MDTAISLNPADTARLMPLYLRISASGEILDAGPTFKKLCDWDELVGNNVLDFFHVQHHRKAETGGSLNDLAGGALRVTMTNAPKTTFKGVLVPLQDGGFLLNLSFGIGVIQAVADYGLSIEDFPPTDLTVEMLYLNEAQSAVLGESRQLINRLQGAKIAAEEKAFTDTLTGLRNRRALDFALDRIIKAGDQFALLQMDLDFFKDVNDTMGHPAGDYVLSHVARILVAETRGEDTVARVGGDEFVLILKGICDRAKIRLIGERIISILERPIRFNGVELKISASIGASVSSDYDQPNSEEMLRHADLALYASKDAGRAAFSSYSSEMG